MISDGVYLTELCFEGRKTESNTGFAFLPKEDLPVFHSAVLWLGIYFRSEDPQFLPPILLEGTPFQKSVWELLLQIPYGKTVSYGEIAKTLAERRGIARMSAQAVGGAVGRNPIALIVPCHRVIGADGSLVGFGGGIERKRRLLYLEGNGDFH